MNLMRFLIISLQLTIIMAERSNKTAAITVEKIAATTMVVVGERVVPAVRVGHVAATVVVDNNTPTIRPRLMLLGLADKHGLGNGWLRGLYLHVHGLLTHGPGPISDNSGSEYNLVFLGPDLHKHTQQHRLQPT